MTGKKRVKALSLTTGESGHSRDMLVRLAPVLDYRRGR